MFKYRVLTFTIILSMLLFYTTPIGSIDVKAEEITYTQRQLQDVGAWFIGERLLEGAVENFNFDNLPTDVTVDDFLADLGSIIAEGNPDPLINDLGQAADDIWNGIEQELVSWSADDAWSLVKDFFYTIWYDVPSSPSLPPLANVFGIAADVLEASGVDKLLQYANTDIPDVDIDPDFSFISNINNFFINGYDVYSYPNYNYDALSSYSYFGNFVDQSFNMHIAEYSVNRIFTFAYRPLITVYVNFDQNSNKYILNETSAGSIVIDNNVNNNNYEWINQIELFSGEIYTIGANNSSGLTKRYVFDSLSICINYIYDHYCNINLYVNNVPWAISYITPINPIASTDLTYHNYEPAKYNYPDNTFVDWNRLYSIIYNAVRDGIVIDFGDLEDCFVDVNGQIAIATLGLVRNDYDNLVQEQFTMVPYPRFNDNLWLTNLAEEMTEPAQNGVAIIENAYNIFPLPLQKALLFAGALLLFGLLIRRFLE